MERERRVPFFKPRYTLGLGTSAADIDGRDHASEAAYTIDELSAGTRLNRKIAVPDLWWKPYYDPHDPSVSLRQHYGLIGRARGPATGQGPTQIVVVQNPTAPMQATARGWENAEKSMRVGTFQAGMHLAATARRRRGQ
jgi:hypothetical protein